MRTGKYSFTKKALPMEEGKTRFNFILIQLIITKVGTIDYVPTCQFSLTLLKWGNPRKI